MVARWQAGRILAAVLFISFATEGTTLHAQSGWDFGRWWWDASIGLGQRNTANSLGGVKSSSYALNQLEASLGLNGFIVHPSVASFRLDTDLTVTQQSGTASVDTDSLGYGAEIKAFQRGNTPFNLYYRRQRYNYSAPGSESSPVVFGNPVTQKQWGGQMSIRRGIFKGVRFGLARDALGFLESGSGLDTNEQNYIEWERRLGFINSRIKIERRTQDFERQRLKLDDLFIRVEESADLSDSWRWVMTGDGIQREITRSDGDIVSTDDYRLRHQFLGYINKRDYLDVRVNTDAVHRDGAPALRREGVSVAYRWRPGRWQVAPFSRYTQLSSDDESARSPQAGLRVSWGGQVRSLQLLLSGDASYRSIAEENSEVYSRSRRFGAGLNSSLVHGKPTGLQKTLDLQWATNEFRIEREPVLELPDFGFSDRTLEAENTYRARIGLDHARGELSLKVWGLWTFRTPSAQDATADPHFETISLGAHWNRDQFGLQSTVGATTNDDGVSAKANTLRYATISTSWYPTRYIRLSAGYSRDSRSLGVAPDIDGEWLDAKATVQFGQLHLEVRAYEHSENLAGETDRSNRGLDWKLSTRFSGWLPIVTGTQRRGGIR